MAVVTPASYEFRYGTADSIAFGLFGQKRGDHRPRRHEVFVTGDYRVGRLSTGKFSLYIRNRQATYLFDATDRVFLSLNGHNAVALQMETLFFASSETKIHWK